jgi:CheY-like chemotaxis protein
MSAFRLLIVEDNEQDLATCRDTVARYCDEKQREVELVECKSVDEAFKKLDNSFDGAIIDLRLDDQGDEGNQVVSRIVESHFRIPVAILTGTPDAADSDFAYIGVFKKGDTGAGYADLLDLFWGIHNTGLTRIMGGRGIIEETLDKVFRENLLPQRDKWVEYGETDSSRTEKALLRHALNHLLQLLDDDGDRSFPEEMYLHPPLSDEIRTGSIVRQKDGDWYVVMNPACDLVIRGNGKYKTDRILLVEIEKEEDVVSLALAGIQKADKKKNKLQTVFGNNHTDYYHWLPKTNFFSGGFLNFRKLSTITKDEFGEKFYGPEIQISPSFIKDVVARFSSYYARQGQPDIECDGFIAHLTSTQEATA